MRILIVEENKIILNFLKKNLEFECFAVDAKSNGVEGSFTARTNDYDAVIISESLREKTGGEICKELRSSGKNFPIIILSQKSEAIDKAYFLNLGADDCLPKPFSFIELLARLRAVLRRPKQVQQQIYTINDLVLDCHNHTVLRGQENIALSRKEFMILECLIKNRGNVLSRGTIMEHVWDIYADPFSNTLETHLVKLRRKIELTGKPKLIQTIQGRGYKINSIIVLFLFLNYLTSYSL